MSTEADPNPTDASSDVTMRADLSGAGKAPSADPIEVDEGSGNTTRTIRADLQHPGNPKGAPVAKSPQAKLGLPAGGIPGYAISRRLGAGGMGQVYEATRESDGCAVALKLLRADAIADPEFRERFQREAEVMQQVSHPNVVGYMGAGEHEGWLYLATELMRDGDLDRYLKRRGQLFEKDALTLVLKAAEGIAAIHAAGLIHRDIKPQNIFLDHKATDTGDL
jgi:serine/threonine protein kinase